MNPLKFTDKAVKSVRSRVVNVSNFLSEEMDISIFSEELMKHIMKKYNVTELYDFSKQDLTMIMALRDEKFATWDWNFGYSPIYDFKKSIKTDYGRLSVDLKIVKGIISDVKFSGDFLLNNKLKELEVFLQGKKHNLSGIREILNRQEVDENLQYIKVNELLEVLF